MEIHPEIELSEQQHSEIQYLRNQSFPDHQVTRSYFKQLPHLRALQYQEGKLVGYMGLDYRVIGVGGSAHKILGVIDLCVDEPLRGKGIGSSMLNDLTDYALEKDVDFIILISDLESFYSANGFQRVETTHSWLRLHEHQNYGVAKEHFDELFVKAVGSKEWSGGDVDWLGYMF